MLCVPAPSSGLAQASHAQLSSETSIEQKEPLQHSSTVWYKQTPLAMPGRGVAMEELCPRVDPKL